MNIAICDDENVFQEQLAQILNEYMGHDSNCGIEIYDDGASLLRNYRNKKFDCIFLDVDMPGPDGFETAAQIRQLDLDVDIVFVTRMSDYVTRGYRYNAKGYICKPITAKDINSLMDRLLDERSRRQGGKKYNIRLKGTSAEIDLRLEDVLYFESNLHYVVAVTPREELAFQCRLAQVEVDLEGKGFLRVHQSYLVNMDYIFAVISNKVIFKDGLAKLEIPLSRKYKESASTLFAEYKARYSCA